MGQARKGQFLDSSWARFLALLCAAASAAALVYIHRDDIWPAGEPANADDPFYQCFAKRSGDIDAMRADGTISKVQALQFRARAEAMCRATTSESSKPPIPGQ